MFVSLNWLLTTVLEVFSTLSLVFFCPTCLFSSNLCAIFSSSLLLFFILFLILTGSSNRILQSQLEAPVLLSPATVFELVFVLTFAHQLFDIFFSLGKFSFKVLGYVTELYLQLKKYI